ncbi:MULTISPECIES: cysteine desulfurase family protein [Bacillaceae]|uniref:Cysteine desulfurase n=1 Tax=Evansella alkalicola TaxID=745819 RepID=A0ABS6JRD2_9BACI|nr:MULTISPECIES: cysteine desulfurase family protein [Bacillaceae]MBU9721112.1 cysteine desulfurase [Bacillus alkalicola]
MIYFDNSATTKPYDEVLDTYTKVATEYFGNPSSLHPLGKISERILTQAREKSAELLNVSPKEIVFTSGGTEGNNLAIKGAARQNKGRGNHLITSTVEHASTLEAFRQLEQEGFDVTYLPVDSEGKVSINQVEQAMTKDTILVSLNHVNNEIGSIQPIEEIGQLLEHFPKCLFHVDHVQGIGKVPLDFYRSKIDLCTISAHKIHGLKGTGILFRRNSVLLNPLFSGGSQEGKFRAGTENVPGSVAMVKALRLTLDNFKQSVQNLETINSWLETECREIEGVFINSPKNRAPHILNMSIPGLKPEVVVQALGEKDIYVSTKSACSSKHAEPSHVLKGIGLSDERAESGIRLSFSYGNTLDEAKEFVEVFSKVVRSIKKVVEDREV